VDEGEPEVESARVLMDVGTLRRWNGYDGYTCIGKGVFVGCLCIKRASLL